MKLNDRKKNSEILKFCLFLMAVFKTSEYNIGAKHYWFSNNATGLKSSFHKENTWSDI